MSLPPLSTSHPVFPSHSQHHYSFVCVCILLEICCTCTSIYIYVFKNRNKWELLGCTLQACKACICPVSRPKKEPGVSNRDISGLMDRGNLMCLKQGPGMTPHHVLQMAGRTWWRSSPEVEQGVIASYRGNWCQVGLSFTRETSRGACPSLPLW